MRTTIRMDPRLLAEAKKAAAENHQTLTAVIEESLRQRLASGRQAARLKPPRLTTFKADGLMPGVDLDDSAALLDVTEGPGAPD
jgi:hypothetical protein